MARAPAVSTSTGRRDSSGSNAGWEEGVRPKLVELAADLAPVALADVAALCLKHPLLLPGVAVALRDEVLAELGVTMNEMDIAESRRGYAGALLDWLIDEGRSLGCTQLHLDSGTGQERFDAHRLYHSHGLAIYSHHFARGL